MTKKIYEDNDDDNGKNGDDRVAFTIRLPKDTFKKLETYAEKHFESKNKIINYAVNEYISQVVCPVCGYRNAGIGVVCSVCGNDLVTDKIREMAIFSFLSEKSSSVGVKFGKDAAGYEYDCEPVVECLNDQSYQYAVKQVVVSPTGDKFLSEKMIPLPTEEVEKYLKVALKEYRDSMLLLTELKNENES